MTLTTPTDELRAAMMLAEAAPDLLRERDALRAEVARLREAATQALWHLGTDEDRAGILADGNGWKTARWEAADLLRAALAGGV